MKSEHRRESFCRATMEVVYECGFAEFSMKKVTVKTDASEALLYKYYPTKETLLFACYELINQEIEELYQKVEIPDTHDHQVLCDMCRQLWERFFEYLVTHPKEAVFYSEYMRTPYFQRKNASVQRVQEALLFPFRSILKKMCRPFLRYDAMIGQCLWIFVIDTTGQFARRVIYGELEDTPELRSLLWNLLSEGICSMM